jgi:hypothetical protein
MVSPDPASGASGVEGEMLGVFDILVVDSRDPAFTSLNWSLNGANLLTAEVRRWGEVIFGGAIAVSEFGFTFALLLLNRGSLVVVLSGRSVFELAGDSSMTPSTVGNLECGADGAVAVIGVAATDRGRSLLGEAGRLLELTFGEDWRLVLFESGNDDGIVTE